MTATAWLVLGGTALYLAGHAPLKAVVWRVLPWSRLLAIAVFLLAVIAADMVSGRGQAS